MIHLVFLLLGTEAVRRQRVALGIIGTIWILLGVAILTETVEHLQHFTIHLLGLILVIEGIVSVLVRASGYRTKVWLLKAVALIIPGLSIIETPVRNLMLVSILFGTALMIDSVVRTISVFLVRFPGWRIALVGTGIEFVLALLAVTPWPVTYEATIPFCISVALMLSGWTVLRSAWLLHRLPPDAPVTSLPIFRAARGWHAALQYAVPQRTLASDRRMIVHVWTPVSSATNPVRRPLIDRYVAAVDRQGTISTGHAALEMPPDLYMSHYGAEDVDRSTKEFRRSLHAGRQNDVRGRFLPSYAEEAAGWCEATEHVEFRRFDADRLRAFWDAYRLEPTYNLTNRNCSVVVALALDAALEGVLAKTRVLPPFVRLLVNPELHLATLLRRRAHTMTWTPGLVLDYARALQRVVEPPPLSWLALLRQAYARWRRGRRGLAALSGSRPA